MRRGVTPAAPVLRSLVTCLAILNFQTTLTARFAPRVRTFKASTVAADVVVLTDGAAQGPKGIH